MKIFLVICLVARLASSEKLDRSYLPPPGSKYSGGSPGDLDVPLEFPRQPTGQPQTGKPDIELGINRRPGTPTPEAPNSPTPGFTFFQTSYPVPKTTTSYAITQTTTFPADYEIDQSNAFVNGSNIPGVQGQNQQPIRGTGQASYNQYRPGQIQSTVAPYGTTARPPFPNTFNGLEYLPPVSDKQIPSQMAHNQDGSGYPSDLPQRTQYQDGQVNSVNRPDYVPPGFNQQNQFIGNQNIPSTVAPQYQDGRFGPTGPGSKETLEQFLGSQFPSSTAAPQAGQRFTTPGSNERNLFLGNQNYPTSTNAPQYQGSQRLTTPGLNQQNQFSENQNIPPSTTAPDFEIGQGSITPGLNQQVFGSRVPNQQSIYPGSQYQGNQYPSSTLSPTPGSIQQNQYSENQNYPSTAAPNYQDGQRLTTPSQNQGLLPGQRPFGTRVPSQYAGKQNVPSSTVAPQLQDSEDFTTPGYVHEGYGYSVPAQKNQYQYPGHQNFHSSTAAPQDHPGQQFTTGPGGQNFPATVSPNYQTGQRYTAPGQEQLVPEQKFGSPNQQGHSQFEGNQNYPPSTVVPQYQESQRFSTPGSQQRNERPQQNQYGNQNFPTSTAAPQYPDQRFSTPRELFNQPNYPGSTAAPRYHQTSGPTPGSNQPAVPIQQNQYQRPIYNQQIPSSTSAPQQFIPGFQPQIGNNNIPTPGTEIAFPQGLPGSVTYGNSQLPKSQTEAGSSIYGTAPSYSNQRFPSTTMGSLPARDFASTPGFGTIGGLRPDRPQAEGDRNAEILNYENVLTPEGYFYSYDTSNGIHADETGEVGNGTRAQGGFTYTGDDGKVYSVVYTADKNGFQPRGDHFPTPPPIPEAIQRVIDQANMDKESGIDDDGSYNEEKYGYMKYEGPLTRLRSKNRTVSVVKGADIPERNEAGIDGQTRKLLKPKGSRQGSNVVTKEKSETADTDTNDSDFEETDVNEGGPKGDMKGTNRRTDGKRPKPIKNLTVEHKRPNQLKRIKMPTNALVNSKKDDTNLRPIPTEEDEDNASDDTSEELENSDDLRDSDDYDFDSDLVNYRDDPNNRTDFHGLNKYLPESKKSNRKNQSGKKRPTLRVDSVKKPVTGESEVETTEYNTESKDTKTDFIDKSRPHIQTRKNKLGQKVKDLSMINGQTVSNDSDDETDTYDDRVDTDGGYDSDDTTKQVNNNRKPESSQSNKISGKTKRPTANQQTGVSNIEKNKPSPYEETGYEYTLPQKQFSSEENTKFPTKTNQKGTQTTVRPFLTKNVYGDENEPTDDYIDQYGNVKPGVPEQPVDALNYPGYNQGSDSYNPQMNQDEGFSTTMRSVSFGISHRPFGKPQTTVTPQYQEIGMTDQEGQSYKQYNPEGNQNQGFSTTRRPIYGTSQRPFGNPQTSVSPYDQDPGVTGNMSYEGSQRPGDKLFYNTNAPNRETARNVFSTTTPLPPSGTNSPKYQRPGQYLDRPTDRPSYTETASPSGEPHIRPNKPGQVPSTTYRPNYSFGDKINAVTKDGSGLPIQSTIAPTFDRTQRPTYSVTTGDFNNQQSRFKPNDRRFGVTSGPGSAPEYQTTSAPIGEDFSGPKQPQRFDPETGYHYK